MNSHDTMRRLRAARPAAVQHGDNDVLFRQIVAGPGDSRLDGSSHRRARLTTLKRPRLLAGGSLGIAGVAAAAAVAFSGGTAAPAFAVTRQADGTILVKLSNPNAIAAADKQLASMGINEQVDYRLAPGTAIHSAPLACKLVRGPGDLTPAPASAGPPVKMQLGSDNTGTNPTANTGLPAGTVHLAACISYPEPASVVSSEGPGHPFGNTGP